MLSLKPSQDVKQAIKDLLIELFDIESSDKTSSEYWQYFQKIKFNDGDILTQQIICKECYTPYITPSTMDDESKNKNHGTSSLRRHLDKYLKNNKNLITKHLTKKPKVSLNKTDEKSLQKNLVDFIIGTGSPFSLVDHPDSKQFMDLCLRLSHKYNTTDFNYFSLARQKVKQHTHEGSLEIKNDFKNPP